jgi:putative NADPH-quinone reductase
MARPERILVILGHPHSESYGGRLAEAYVAGARESGAEVRYLRLGDLEFDPVLHWGYERIQPLEPDLLEAQAAMEWAEHWVIVFPVWWGMVPALLKGFMDRAVLPSWGFKFRECSMLWDRLLAGRSARLLVTMDLWPWVFRLLLGSPAVRAMRQSFLKFCGVSPVRTTYLGSVRYAQRERLERWRRQVEELGRRRA